MPPASNGRTEGAGGRVVIGDRQELGTGKPTLVGPVHDKGSYRKPTLVGGVVIGNQLSSVQYKRPAGG